MENAMHRTARRNPTGNHSERNIACGYARVSTDQQADRGVSLDAQAEKIRAMATVHDAELLDVIVDGGESGKSLQRPGIARLLQLVDRRGIQIVIIAKL